MITVYLLIYQTAKNKTFQGIVRTNVILKHFVLEQRKLPKRVSGVIRSVVEDIRYHFIEHGMCKYVHKLISSIQSVPVVVSVLSVFMHGIHSDSHRTKSGVTVGSIN